MNDYLNKVERQLTELTERGAHRRLWARTASRFAASPGASRRWLRSDALAVAAAVAVVGVVVAVIIGSSGGGGGHNAPPISPATRTSTQDSTTSTSHGSHSTQTATTQSSSSTQAGFPGPVGPVPAGLAPRSFTAISDTTWWLMGNAPCSSPPCTSIVRTTNGGRSFVGIPAPRVAISDASSLPGVSQLRFADPLDGFAYGSDLYTTHDGGAHWRALHIGAVVLQLAISNGYAYAVVLPSTHSSAGVLMRAFVGGDDWNKLPAAGDVSGGLWIRGTDVLVQSGAGGAIGTKLLVSHDSGATFASYAAPSPGLPCDFEAPAPPVVWAHCATGTESSVWRSSDYGAVFQLANGHAQQQGEPNSAEFAAASETAAVVGYNQLSRTGDSGDSYTPVGPSGLLWEYLGFTDATHGVAIGFPSSSSAAASRLYYTIDGGLSYHPVTIR